MARWMQLVVCVAALCAGAGCWGVSRTPQEQHELLERRKLAVESRSQGIKDDVIVFAQATKVRYDDFEAGKRPRAPIVDYLVISGGGDWGAFGAGFLKGWGKVPREHVLSRPHFEIVTGVSTGALIAPFAFIDDDEAYEAINQLYRNPEKDWVKSRWPLAFLPMNISLAETPGLERKIKEEFTLEFAQKIVDNAKDGRFLAVNTTNLDDASARVFQLVPEAQRALETKDMSRLHNILLASAGIPGAFPYREIDGEMYVDGGVTNNIIYGGTIGEEDSLPAVWQRLYPDTPIPKIRYWIIINNQLYAPPVVTPARWPSIVMRSVSMSIRASNLIALRHVYAMAEISRLKRNAEVEVRVVSIPDDWYPPKPGTFVKETMNDLADLGERMGADVNSWRSDPPGP